MIKQATDVRCARTRAQGRKSCTCVDRGKLNMQRKQTVDARRARKRAQDRKSRIIMFGSRRDFTENKRQTLCVPAHVHRGEGVARVWQDCTENKAYARMHRAKGVARVCIVTRLHAQRYLMILRFYRRSSHNRCAQTRGTNVGQAIDNLVPYLWSGRQGYLADRRKKGIDRLSIYIAQIRVMPFSPPKKLSCESHGYLYFAAHTPPF